MRTLVAIFNRALVYLVGIVILAVYAVDRAIHVNFLIIETLLSMNMNIRREWIHDVKEVVSTLHQVMRCQSTNELYMIDIKGDHNQGKSCYNIIHGQEVHKLNE